MTLQPDLEVQDASGARSRPGHVAHAYLTVMASWAPTFLLLATPVVYWLVQTWRMQRRLAGCVRSGWPT
jgi:hypothetical protein